MTTPRPYRDQADWKRLCRLLIDGRKSNNGSYYVHVGDVSWWMYHPDVRRWISRTEVEGDFPERIFLCEDGAQLLGCSILPPDGGLIYVFIHPGQRGTALEAQMIAWSEDRLRFLEPDLRRTTHMWIGEGDVVRRRLLEHRGYELSAQFGIYMTRSLSAQVPEPKLPPGFTIRSLDGEREIPLRSATARAAFNSPLPQEHHCERYLLYMRSPVYKRGDDLIVVAPDGRVAAYCTIWLDDVNRVGLFEPVGTHPDFRTRGLGKALMTSALAKMAGRAMRSAIVCPNGDNQPAIRLYESAGFECGQRLFTFSKAC